MKKLLLTTALTVLMTGQALAELDKCPDVKEQDFERACRGETVTLEGRHKMRALHCEAGVEFGDGTVTSGEKIRNLDPNSTTLKCQYKHTSKRLLAEFTDKAEFSDKGT